MDKTMKDGDLQDVRKFLRQTAAGTPPRRASVFETVSALLPEILALKKKRYTDEEICRLLGEKGIKLSLGTFRQYYRRARIVQRGAPESRSKEIAMTRSIAADKARPPGRTQNSAARVIKPFGVGHRLDEEL
jgi:hypothetical protein